MMDTRSKHNNSKHMKINNTDISQTVGPVYSPASPIEVVSSMSVINSEELLKGTEVSTV